jgi:hypothetical protein
MRYKRPAFTRWDTCAGRVAATRTRTQKYEKYEGYKHALPRSSVIVQLLADEGVVQEIWRQKEQKMLFVSTRIDRNGDRFAALDGW